MTTTLCLSPVASLPASGITYVRLGPIKKEARNVIWTGLGKGIVYTKKKTMEVVARETPVGLHKIERHRKIKWKNTSTGFIPTFPIRVERSKKIREGVSTL